MAHAISSNTNLLSFEITRTHTQMRKSPRGEKESGKGMRSETERKKIKKIEKKRKINKI